MSFDLIDRLYSENKDTIAYLNKAGEISLASATDSTFRKTLLLSVASFFETRIRECLLEFVSERTANDPTIMALLRAKAIERQYHTYFDWDRKNANRFFSLFGEDFKKFMERHLKEEASLETAVRDFLELGRLRNELVHLNFATFPLEKTSEEIFGMYQNASAFVACIPTKLRTFLGEFLAAKVDGTSGENLG